MKTYKCEAQQFADKCGNSLAGRIRDMLQVTIDCHPATRSSFDSNSNMECDKAIPSNKIRQCYGQNAGHELEHSEHVRSSMERNRYFNYFMREDPMIQKQVH